MIDNEPGGNETDMSSKRGQGSVQRNLLWLIAGLLAVAVLSLTAAYAPPILKRLVVFHAVFGVASGFILLWLASEIAPTWKRSLPFLGALICLAGMFHLAWLSHRQFISVRQESPKDAALQSMIEQISEQDAELRERYQQEKERTRPSFSNYLKHRVKNAGDWPQPWPAIFWGVELLIGCSLCFLTIRMRLSADSRQGQ